MDIDLNSHCIIIIDKIKKYFFENELLREFLLYMDSYNSLKYIYDIPITNLNIYCVNQNIKTNFLDTIKIVKQIKSYNNLLDDNTEFKISTSVINYYNDSSDNNGYNKYRNKIDNLEMYYVVNSQDIGIQKHFGITFYFFNKIDFYNSNEFTNIEKSNKIHLNVEDNKNTLNDIYWVISKEELIIVDDKSTNIFKILHKTNLEEYISNLFQYELTNLFLNPNIFIEVIYLYLVTKIEKFYNLIISFIDIYSNDKSLKKKIKKLIDFTDYNYLNFLLSFFDAISQNNLFNKFMKLVDEYPLINKILYNCDIVKTYGIRIDSAETLIKLLFIDKYNIINKNYENYVSENIFFKKDDLNISDNFNFFEDKFELYKKMKKYCLKKKINIFTTNNIDLQDISIFCEILSILFYCEKNQLSNIVSLKLSYIFNKFNYIGYEKLEKIINIFNQITSDLNIENIIKPDDFIFEMFKNKNNLINSVNLISLNIPEVKLQYTNDTDNINIYDFQDSFCLVYELIYFTKPNLNDFDVLKNIFDDYMESVLAGIRANKLIKSNYDTDNYFDSFNNLFVYDDKNYSFNDINYEKKKKYSISNKKNKEDLDFYKLDKCTSVKEIEDELQNMLDNYSSNFNVKRKYNQSYSFDEYLADTESQEKLEEYLINPEDLIDHEYLMDHESFNELTNEKFLFDTINNINDICKLSEYDNSDNINIDINLDYDLIENSETICDLNENNFIDNSIKSLKYEKYKDEYQKLKNIDKIVSNNYFDITIFDKSLDKEFIKLVENFYIIHSDIEPIIEESIIEESIIDEPIIDKVNKINEIINLSDIHDYTKNMLDEIVEKVIIKLTLYDIIDKIEKNLN